MRVSRAYVFLIGLLVATVAIALVVVLASDDGAPQTAGSAPTTSPPAQTTATSTPVEASPTSADHGPFADLRLEPQPRVLEFVSGGLDAIPEGLGVYYLDVDSGALEGWHLPDRDPYGGAIFVLSSDNRMVALNEERLLADRQTRTVYRWSGDAQVVVTSGTPSGENPLPREQQLASAGSRVLFRYAEPDADDWFALIELEPDPRVVKTFRTEGGPAILSPDGAQAAIFGAKLALIDLASGTVEPLAGAFPPELGSKTVLTLRNTMGGDGLLLTAAPFSSDEVEGFWQHYTWQGDLLAKGSRTIYASPDGDRAWTLDDGPVPISNAIDLTSGETIFRVVGATARQAYPVLEVPPRGSVRGWAAVIGGEVRELPIEGYPPSSMYPGPGPNPRFAGFVLDLSLSAFDAQGKVLAAYSPDPSTSVLGVSRSVLPWGDTDAELRFAVAPRGSDDCCFTYSLVIPRLEERPFSDPPVVGLHNDAEGEPLYDSPGGEVIGEIAPPLTVTMQKADLLAEPSDRVNSIHCEFLARHTILRGECGGMYAGLWLLVTASDGEEGWLLVQVNPVGL